MNCFCSQAETEKATQSEALLGVIIFIQLHDSPWHKRIPRLLPHAGLMVQVPGCAFHIR